MSDKQTRCPKCSTVYKVTLSQLNAAQGMVCCPKCIINFNALTHLIHPEPAIDAINYHNRSIFSSIANSPVCTRADILNIFEQKIENSNIDLQTYLNNLNYFNTEPVTALPNLNLSEHSQYIDLSTPSKRKKSWFYYSLWGFANIALLIILAAQIFWFNPQLLYSQPVLKNITQWVCIQLKCKTTEEKYRNLHFQKLKVQQISFDEVQFSGVLINYNKKSVVLAPIQVTLLSQGKPRSKTIYTSEQYLDDSLKSIQRIPSERPFKFKIIVQDRKKHFDDYRLEFIQP